MGKLPIGATAQVVQQLQTFDDANLLVGAEHFSDAGVYRIADNQAIVVTLDFFPPIVDDPFVYGQIAAANSLSDVYAMGATPKTALNIVCFPDDKLPMEVMHQILRGGADRVLAAGAVIIGGHSVRDTEIKYGLSVTGIVNPRTMMTNSAAKPRDILVLTKALGTGFVSTAHRAGRCPNHVLKAACASMIQLNKQAAEAAVAVDALAATDVSGFGLAGHAYEVAQASHVTIHLEVSRLPLLPGVKALSGRGNRSRANATNRDHVAPSLRFEGEQDSPGAGFLFDPQTSGGLLIAVSPDRANDLVKRCGDAGLGATTVIGSVVAKQNEHLIIHA